MCTLMRAPKAKLAQLFPARQERSGKTRSPPIGRVHVVVAKANHCSCVFTMRGLWRTRVCQAKVSLSTSKPKRGARVRCNDAMRRAKKHGHQPVDRLDQGPHFEAKDFLIVRKGLVAQFRGDLSLPKLFPALFSFFFF